MQSSLSSSSSSSSLATTVASVGGGQSSTLPSMKNVNQSTISNTAAAIITTPSPTLSTASSIGVANLNADPAGGNVSVATVNPTTTANQIDSNVLNDIGNMLANLTDELDAMLEEEKRAGLNDSE